MFGLFVGLVVAMNYAFKRTKWGTLDDGRRRQPGSGATRGHQRSPDLYERFACAPRSRRAAASWLRPGLPAQASRPDTGDVNLNAIASAVIGGTSLFGGRGSAYSALLGINRHTVHR